MGFTAKDPDLLGEQYRNIDEEIKLSSAERALTLQIESAKAERETVRSRRRELRLRNEEICYQLRSKRDYNVSRVEFVNRIRLGQAA